VLYFVADMLLDERNAKLEVRLAHVAPEHPTVPVPEVRPLKVMTPLSPPTAPREGCEVYVGAAAEAVAFPRTVPAPAFAKAPVTVPVVVTAVLGVELRTVPSPVNVTLVTVPDPPPPETVVTTPFGHILYRFDDVLYQIVAFVQGDGSVENCATFSPPKFCCCAHAEPISTAKIRVSFRL
jgi:hypothetical protein